MLESTHRPHAPAPATTRPDARRVGPARPSRFLALSSASLLAACASTASGAPPAAPAPALAAQAPAAPTAPAARRYSPLVWDAADGAIACSQTGTRVPVPPEWRGAVRQTAGNDVQLAAGGAASPAALLVRVARGGATRDAFLADWARLRALLGDGTGNVTVRHLAQSGDTTEIEYDAPPSGPGPSTRYRLAYRAIERNGVVLRIAEAEREGLAPRDSLAPLLARVQDSPALDLAVARSASPASNAVWNVLLGIQAIDAFLHPFHRQRPVYATPPGVPSS